MGFWKTRRLRAEEREADIEQARVALITSQREEQEVLDRAPAVAAMAAYLAHRREMNHFAEALSQSGYKPRSSHA